jgi:hypothetical protein
LDDAPINIDLFYCTSFSENIKNSHTVAHVLDRKKFSKWLKNRADNPYGN